MSYEDFASTLGFESKVQMSFEYALNMLQRDYPSAIPADIISAIVDGIRQISLQDVSRKIDIYVGVSIDTGFNLHFWIYKVKVIWRSLKLERDKIYAQVVKNTLDNNIKVKELVQSLAYGDPQYQAAAQRYDEVGDFLEFLSRIEKLIEERHYLLVQISKYVSGGHISKYE